MHSLKNLYIFILFVFGLKCAAARSQSLPGPEVKIESYIFKDSTLVSAYSNQEDGSIMMETGIGSGLMFVSYKKPFYVSESKTLRFKLVHPDQEDSEIVIIKVHKISNLNAEILGEQSCLADLKRGSATLEHESWYKSKTDKTSIQFSTENKKLQEVELLCYIDSEKGILPPKKIALYAHLKNGTKVHIRSTNTLGKFTNKKHFWNQTLRLNGKPKLKKILKKTVYFSLEITPHFLNDQPEWLYLDEVLVR